MEVGPDILKNLASSDISTDSKLYKLKITLFYVNNAFL